MPARLRRPSTNKQIIGHQTGTIPYPSPGSLADQHRLFHNQHYCGGALDPSERAQHPISRLTVSICGFRISDKWSDVYGGTSACFIIDPRRLLGTRVRRDVKSPLRPWLKRRRGHSLPMVENDRYGVIPIGSIDGNLLKMKRVSLVHLSKLCRDCRRSRWADV